MPTATAGHRQVNYHTNAMAAQMKTMNIIMPLFSFVMCFTVPVVLGIYWISAVFRAVQQFFINKHMEKGGKN